MNDSTDRGLPSATSPFPYFLPRQPNKLDHKTSESYKKAKNQQNPASFGMYFQYERSRGLINVKEQGLKAVHSRSLPSLPYHIGVLL